MGRLNDQDLLQLWQDFVLAPPLLLALCSAERRPRLYLGQLALGAWWLGLGRRGRRQWKLAFNQLYHHPRLTRLSFGAPSPLSSHPRNEVGEDFLAAVYVVTFDVRKGEWGAARWARAGAGETANHCLTPIDPDSLTGNIVQWKYPEDVEVPGVEFKSMPSGSHAIENDFV